MRISWKRSLIPGGGYFASVDRQDRSTDNLAVVSAQGGVAGLLNGRPIAHGDTVEAACRATTAEYERLRRPKRVACNVERDTISAEAAEWMREE